MLWHSHVRRSASNAYPFQQELAPETLCLSSANILCLLSDFTSLGLPSHVPSIP